MKTAVKVDEESASLPCQQCASDSRTAVDQGAGSAEDWAWNTLAMRRLPLNHVLGRDLRRHNQVVQHQQHALFTVNNTSRFGSAQLGASMFNDPNHQNRSRRVDFYIYAGDSWWESPIKRFYTEERSCSFTSISFLGRPLLHTTILLGEHVRFRS